MCPYFATSFTAEGLVTVYVMVMVATDARGPVLVDWEAQLVVDAEKECYRGEAMFVATAGHCNDRVRHVGGKNVWKEVKVFVFMLKYMVVKL